MREKKGHRATLRQKKRATEIITLWLSLFCLSVALCPFFSLNWNGKFFKTVIIVNSAWIFNDQQKDNNSP